MIRHAELRARGAIRWFGVLGTLWLPLLLGLPLAGNAEGVGLSVSDAFIRGMPPGQSVTAAFLSLHNNTDNDYTLTGITIPVAKKAEIHAHLHADGMMRMRALAELKIAAHSTRKFAPGGYHIMLFGVNRVLRSGEKFPLTLTFDSGEQLQVMASVRSVLDEAQ